MKKIKKIVYLFLIILMLINAKNFHASKYKGIISTSDDNHILFEGKDPSELEDLKVNDKNVKKIILENDDILYTLNLIDFYTNLDDIKKQIKSEEKKIDEMNQLKKDKEYKKSVDLLVEQNKAKDAISALYYLSNVVKNKYIDKVDEQTTKENITSILQTAKKLDNIALKEEKKINSLKVKKIQDLNNKNKNRNLIITIVVSIVVIIVLIVSLLVIKRKWRK